MNKDRAGLSEKDMKVFNLLQNLIDPYDPALIQRIYDIYSLNYDYTIREIIIIGQEVMCE